MEKESSILLGIPLIQERYGPSLLVSIGIHAVVVLIILFGGYLLPSTVVHIGSGPGGGTGGDISATVGVVDDLSGGAGMVKPSIVPRPPALKEKPAPPEQKAIPLPQTLRPKKNKIDSREAKNTKPIPDSNRIPTAPEPGSGGIGRSSGGSGGGIGAGNGVSIGPGSGGLGDSSYARQVEDRIGRNWIKPPEGMHVEMVYSFYIFANGAIGGIKLEKSSRNTQIDFNAERAIRLLTDLPPPHMGIRPIQFIVQFIYPPSP
jgi:outer membrane biosynthesis protein TonB